MTSRARFAAVPEPDYEAIKDFISKLIPENCLNISAKFELSSGLPSSFPELFEPLSLGGKNPKFPLI